VDVLKLGMLVMIIQLLIFGSVVGRPKTPPAMPISNRDYFIGKEAQVKRGLLSMTYPIASGVINDWTDMERLWAHTFLTELKAAPEEHHLLITEHPLQPKINRIKTTEIMFEKFNIPYLFFMVQSFLALYASGRATGIVVDCGAGVTTAFPIWEGFGIPIGVLRVDNGGNNLNNYLMRLINERGLTLNSSGDVDICREIKEKFGYVAKDFAEELTFSKTSPQDVQKVYILPDGQELILRDEHFRCAEALFQPSVLGNERNGLHEITYESIIRSPVDIRLNLYSNIILCGGSSCFPGLPERYTAELKKLAPSTVHANLNIVAQENRKHLVWIGGSVLATILSNHSAMWASKEEYEDKGPLICQTKFY